jgi:hypothetical protein
LKEYNFISMVNPKIWGESGWRFLICCVADYADNPGIQMQHNYNRFFYHLRWTLPCEICRSNYEGHFKRWPIDQYLKSRAALFRWIMIMYNEVQTSLNKKTKGPQELLYELFGKEEGERMMQRLVYEDPDANITVIKPFDPTIAQYGGNTNMPTANKDTTLKLDNVKSYPSRIANMTLPDQNNLSAREEYLTTREGYFTSGMDSASNINLFLVALVVLLLLYILWKR